jgi:hypothetical protein
MVVVFSILENEALIGDIIYVESRVGKYKNANLVEMAFAIPSTEYFLMPYKTISTTTNGKVYQMVLTDSSADLYELYFTKHTNSKIDSSIISKVNPKPIVAIADNSYKSGSVTTLAVSKSSALSRAKGMSSSSFNWTYYPDIHKTPNTSLKKPPAHLDYSKNGGWSEWGLPYTWGGTNGTDTIYTGSYPKFTDNITSNSSGKTAGNVNTTGYYQSGTFGVDCSGFISIAYDLGTRLSSTDFLNDTATFKTISFSNMEPGDIGVRSGHIWMLESWRMTNGEITGVWTYEATTDGYWQRAKLFSRSLSSSSFVENGGTYWRDGTNSYTARALK